MRGFTEAAATVAALLAVIYFHSPVTENKPSCGANMTTMISIQCKKLLGADNNLNNYYKRLIIIAGRVLLYWVNRHKEKHLGNRGYIRQKLLLSVSLFQSKKNRGKNSDRTGMKEPQKIANQNIG